MLSLHNYGVRIFLSTDNPHDHGQLWAVAGGYVCLGRQYRQEGSFLVSGWTGTCPRLDLSERRKRKRHRGRGATVVVGRNAEASLITYAAHSGHRRPGRINYKGSNYDGHILVCLYLMPPQSSSPRHLLFGPPSCIRLFIRDRKPHIPKKPATRLFIRLCIG